MTGGTAAESVATGRAALGIEFGSTRIKACLIDPARPTEVLATGSHAWENAYADGSWTYDLDDVWTGVQAAIAELRTDVERRHGVSLTEVGALGVSAMMHGYLAFDDEGNLLVPFRTWRNTTTGAAAAELSALFGVNIPLRWSIAHLHQAILDGEAHVPAVRSLTTLAGYVHARLSGQHVLGVGDASGMFPIDPATGDYDAALVAAFDARDAEALDGRSVRDLLPTVLPAGAPAGTLTDAGALLLDPSGSLRPGAPMCPPEGDAGTGMVATGAVAPRTGNVSAGTSIFAMVVLEKPLAEPNEELDIVATPAGDPVAMVHCNNGASELAAWAGMFARFAAAAGTPLDDDAVYDILFREALDADADAGGLLAYNYLAGEPITGLREGRPLFVRTPESTLTLGNAIRAQLFGVFGTLALGMEVLHAEKVALDRMHAHGGMFRTAGVAQRFLAAALEAPVAVSDTAAEGGAWGMALLAAFAAETSRGGMPGVSLSSYLDEHVFDSAPNLVAPDPHDVAGFASYLTQYRAGLAVEAAAATHL